ncbi:hypothetical protein [Bartonella fuyuanensis]|uniref:hypothetical protein n=1 Tax=Bartonella fuyuanensis TaxID=1460968 RepID=UPI0031B5E14A
MMVLIVFHMRFTSFLILNLFTVKLFGEPEFLFGFIKTIAILILIVVEFYISLTDFVFLNNTIASLGQG